MVKTNLDDDDNVDLDSWECSTREPLQAELYEQLEAVKAQMRNQLQMEIVVAKRRIKARLVADLRAVRGLSRFQPLNDFDKAALSTINIIISVGMSEFFITTSQRYSELLDNSAAELLEMFISRMESAYPHHF
jgi:hypothetical protein